MEAALRSEVIRRLVEIHQPELILRRVEVLRPEVIPRPTEALHRLAVTWVARSRAAATSSIRGIRLYNLKIQKVRFP
jgi:hypothetical protein